MGNSSGSQKADKEWEEFLKSQYEYPFPRYIHSHFGEISIYANKLNLNQMIFCKRLFGNNLFKSKKTTSKNHY